MNLEIVDAPEAERYEARLDGELVGVLEYKLRRSRIALIHTEVAAGHEGRGFAARIARFALGDARQRGLGVIPTCPYVLAYLERHPEERDVVRGRAAGAGS